MSDRHPEPTGDIVRIDQNDRIWRRQPDGSWKLPGYNPVPLRVLSQWCGKTELMYLTPVTAHRTHICAGSAHLEQELAQARSERDDARRVITQLSIENDQTRANAQAANRRAADEKAIADHLRNRFRSDRAELMRAYVTIDQYDDLITELRDVHVPRGPWCSECDYDDGTLTNGDCPHMLRYCQVCWRNEDKREKWPCRTIAAIDAVQSLLTNQTQSTASNDWADDPTISAAETLKRFNELDPTTIINQSSNEGNRDD